MKKMRQPVKKGVAKVPVVMQLEALECGAACLTMVLAYYNKWISLEQVRKECGVSRDGSKAKNIVLAAQRYGLETKAYRYEPEQLIEKGTYPCIIHWNFNHFVVLNGFKKGQAVINDPAEGEYAVSMEEFDQAFTGVCLFFKPGDEFYPSGAQKSVISFAGKRMAGMEKAIGFIVLTTALLSFVRMILSSMDRFFLDYLFDGKNTEWVPAFFLLLAAFSLVQILLAWIQAICNLKIKGKLAVEGAATYFWKVLRLPMDFFSQRMAGDLVQRKESNEKVAQTLVSTFAPMMLNAAMMLVYFGVMLSYSIPLALIGGGSVLMKLVVSRNIAEKKVNVTRVQLRDEGKLAGMTFSGIEMIETIKASGAENGFFEKWSGYQAGVNRQNVRYVGLTQYLGLVPSVITAVTDSVILMLGVWLTIKGEFSVGMILAFQGFFMAFSEPAQTFLTAGQQIQEMRTDMERIDDVMDYPADVMLKARAVQKEADEDVDKLSGNVVLRNVTFGYSSLEEPLIKDFSLELQPGSRIAIVGSSGCGKSTLAKLISGLYHPWEGEILFDGKPISDIDRNVFTGSVAVVDQDIILFEDTIANNIKMWDSSVKDFEVIMAARDARIHEDIIQRPGGYQYKMAEGGRDFSGGQKQRLEIARVLAQDPTILIMDEATSALDARTECEVVNSIQDRGITCVVIAHRLSTIRDCDEIIVMDRGNVVQRGSHEELYGQEGLYRQLISSE
ncbi:MAG: NHLP family bacteriocin export ABC transporter peptidase/permease/ATPase subunit [Eubacteriales bacterium]|nr:NHLP family bacteriocin export ABC transporter peptidase/permease/ATPase subunit [Eubacteriales bacterium]